MLSSGLAANPPPLRRDRSSRSLTSRVNRSACSSIAAAESIALQRLALRERLDRRERRSQIVRHRRQHDVLQPVGLAQRFGVLRLGDESHAVGGEGRVVGDRVEKASLRRVQLDGFLVRDGEQAHGPRLHQQRNEDSLNHVPGSWPAGNPLSSGG